MTQEHFDVVVVGSGLSGIDAAYHVQTYCRNKSYVILESRDAIGGTWDLFRYPGIRSDSDMYTFGYSFRPWQSNASIAEGGLIRSYIRETAEAYGIDRNIRFRHRVTRASWSSADALWTIEAERGADREPVRFTCNFLFGCTGYYDYAGGYAPEFAGAEKFRGRIIHPQQWPEALDYAGKRVVVIGSGATAVTIIPAMAETAAQVTMLQRSPTYIVARPSQDPFVIWLRRHLPTKLAHDSPLAQRPARALFVQPLPPQTGGGQAARSWSWRVESSAPIMTSKPISRRATIPGISACVSRPTPTSSAPSRPARPTS